MRTQYSRANHMSDYLRRLQAQEPHRVPFDVVESVRDALPGDPSLELVDRALRRLNLHQYADHAVQIYCRIAGLEPLTLDPDQQLTFWRHFTHVVRVWPAAKSFFTIPLPRRAVAAIPRHRCTSVCCANQAAKPSRCLPAVKIVKNPSNPKKKLYFYFFYKKKVF